MGPSPLGVILAGGRARRMGGGDKGRLRLGGSCLFDHVMARLAPQVPAMALNANGDPARLADLGLPIVADGDDSFAGPLAGVLAGLDWAASRRARRIVTVAADTPFFPEDLVARLTRAAETSDAPIALAATEIGERVVHHPTFGLWPVALRDDLRAALAAGTRKVTAWTDRHDAATALIPGGDPDPFFNVNVPADLALANQHLAALQ